MKLCYSVFSIFLLLGIANPAFAYLDPGAGSFMLQMLIAGVMGALFTIKLYWYRFRSFVARLFGKNIDNPMEEDNTDDDGEEEHDSSKKD